MLRRKSGWAWLRATLKLRTLDQLYTLFQNAPVLGSLIDPQRVRQDLFTTDYQVVAELLEKALSNGHSDEVHEAGVVAHGLARAASLLAGKYHWVITNVPYLTRGKQGEVLRSFCDANYPDGKNDLANVFLERCLQFLVPGGTTSIVMPQNWLFLTSYKRFREKLLENDTWHMIARLGPQAFQTPMWDFNVQLLTMTKGIAPEGHTLCGLDVSEPRSPEEKAALLVEPMKSRAGCADGNPDARWLRSYQTLLQAGICVVGINRRFPALRFLGGRIPGRSSDSREGLRIRGGCMVLVGRDLRV